MPARDVEHVDAGSVAVDGDGAVLAAGHELHGTDQPEQFAVGRIAFDPTGVVFGGVDGAARTEGHVHRIAATAEAFESRARTVSPLADQLAVAIVAADAVLGILGDEQAVLAGLDVHLSAAAAEAGDDHLAAGQIGGSILQTSKP